MTSEDELEILAAARAVFQSEAVELLAQFEAALLVIERQPDDAEAMNSAFRAAHTMKGSGGLFGCDALVAFTHEVESLLDDLRAGALALSEDIMAVLLLSRDQLEALLGELDQPQSSPEVAATSESLGARLRALREGASAPAPAPAPSRADAPASASGAREWHIRLAMGADALRNGLDPLSFVRYLATLGTLTRVVTDESRVPELVELDPEACVLSFDIHFSGDRDHAEIVQVFDFLADDCELVVEEVGAAVVPVAATQVAVVEAVVDAAPVAAPANELRAADGDRRQAARRGDDQRFIRVRADKLDTLIDLIGELVIASSGAQMVAQQEQSARFVESAARIHDLVQSARDGALGLRMVPIGESFARFHRVVRDVSKQLGKDVELQITGAETEMDKSMVESIADPLMHLVRNSLDHGIEMPADRVAAGKPATGRLALHAYHESGAIAIEVSDDGKGLDRERILAKAISRGLVDAETAAAMPDDAVWQLIFEAGFSTADQVTNLSGRGVGMDVVRSNVEALRGQIRIASMAGRGATMQLRLPLTLAIIDGFLTSIGGVHYVLPLDIVAECIEMPAECDEPIAGASGTFDLRGDVVPFIDLRRLFRLGGKPSARRSLVVVRTSAGQLGLLVDRLHGEYQTVIKPLSAIFAQLPGIAGSTILGSGEVALILDVGALERQALADQSRRLPASPSVSALGA